MACDCAGEAGDRLVGEPVLDDKAQLCRIVIKADNNSAVNLGIGRIWFAVAMRYA